MCVKCRYKHKCVSYPDKCDRCANNKGRKDYFVPECDPWTPWYPWHPYPWTYPYIWYDTDGDYTNDNDARWDFFTSISVM